MHMISNLSWMHFIITTIARLDQIMGDKTVNTKYLSQRMFCKIWRVTESPSGNMKQTLPEKHIISGALHAHPRRVLQLKCNPKNTHKPSGTEGIIRWACVGCDIARIDRAAIRRIFHFSPTSTIANVAQPRITKDQTLRSQWALRGISQAERVEIFSLASVKKKQRCNFSLKHYLPPAHLEAKSLLEFKTAEPTPPSRAPQFILCWELICSIF